MEDDEFFDALLLAWIAKHTEPGEDVPWEVKELLWDLLEWDLCGPG